MTGKELIRKFASPEGEPVFETLYGENGITEARRRYTALVEGFLGGFPPGDFPETAGDLRLFTAAGRTELGGNHTDHNRGKVLAASIQLDSVAVAAPREDMRVVFRSTGYPDVTVDLSCLEALPAEAGTTEALVRGVAAELTRRGTPVRGFTAHADSTVFPGSGLSSSAALEVLLARIFDAFYGGGKRQALEIAQIGQVAENRYFGKPSGLMDQIACASGGAAAIDFADNDAPRIQRLSFDPMAAGYNLCVVNTRGSHADLTPDYAAIPEEMKAVAAFFGKRFLRETSLEKVLSGGTELRKAVGDRAILRAIHFFEENQRLDAMVDALRAVETVADPWEKQGDMARFLALVNQSGDSSWELLQNVCSARRDGEQSLGLALTITRNFLRGNSVYRGAFNGACRVHGGGFAGTIQAYVPLGDLDAYRTRIEGLFGPGAVTVLFIRPVGAEELIF
ncbi:MAG: galactokinase [Spirochaetaceae bacterium]|jgi:galactokinase|nr:galactokinase [Spirochaetaceae bacterium]